jgi:hypothetical protein
LDLIRNKESFELYYFNKLGASPTEFEKNSNFVFKN